jgi:hypothetical protein
LFLDFDGSEVVDRNRVVVVLYIGFLMWPVAGAAGQVVGRAFETSSMCCQLELTTQV